MHDPAYKLLFSRPGMVRDLLDGFAARGWSGALDFDTLAPLPASFVSKDLRQRHGDLVWRIRFRDDRWLYLVLLLEFQATVDAAMALRMLTYTALLYQRLDADGVLRDRGALPPVLPVVLYNGHRPWTAPVEMTDLVAVGSDLLAPYQPSQRYYLLDGARVADADLPADNLVSALIGLEKSGDAARLREALRALGDLQAGRKFDAVAAEGLAAALAGVTDPDRLARVGDWIIECATGSELLARVRGDNGSGG